MTVAEFSSRAIFEKLVEEYVRDYNWQIEKKEDNSATLSREHYSDMNISLEEELTEGTKFIWISICDVDRTDFDDVHFLYFQKEGKNFYLLANPSIGTGGKMYYNIELLLLNDDFDIFSTHPDEILSKIEKRETILEIKEMIDWFEEKIWDLKPYRLFFVTGLVEIEKEEIIRNIQE